MHKCRCSKCTAGHLQSKYLHCFWPMFRSSWGSSPLSTIVTRHWQLHVIDSCTFFLYSIAVATGLQCTHISIHPLFWSQCPKCYSQGITLCSRPPVLCYLLSSKVMMLELDMTCTCMCFPMCLNVPPPVVHLWVSTFGCGWIAEHQGPVRSSVPNEVQTYRWKNQFVAKQLIVHLTYGWCWKAVCNS